MLDRRIFTDLLKITVGASSGFGRELSRQDWEDLFVEASRQAILGVTFRAIDSLPDGKRPHLAVYSKWALASEKISANYNERYEKSAELYRLFSEEGFRSCVLKGCGLATYYPEPSSRQCGDIDIWVEGERKSLIALVGEKCKVGDVVYHHMEARFYKGVEVEVHFIPTFFNSPFTNLKFRRYLSANSDGQFSNISSLGFPVPTTGFNLVFCMVHMLQHVFSGGVGLRQVLDYYYLLSASSAEERVAAAGTLETFGLGRFPASVMYIEKVLFGLPESSLICPPDEKFGEFLLDDVLKSGNFGHHDPRNKYKGTDSAIKRFITRNHRIFRFIFISPAEVLWAPFFKIWQFLWRKRNGYFE